MLMRELKDPRLHGVSLTHVQMDNDLRHGRVFFSHLEGVEHAESALSGFKSAKGFIRHEIGQRLNLRYAPELDFQYDRGIEHAARINELLRSENQQKK